MRCRDIGEKSGSVFESETDLDAGNYKCELDIVNTCTCILYYSRAVEEIHKTLTATPILGSTLYCGPFNFGNTIQIQSTPIDQACRSVASVGKLTLTTRTRAMYRYYR